MPDNDSKIMQVCNTAKESFVTLPFLGVVLIVVAAISYLFQMNVSLANEYRVEIAAAKSRIAILEESKIQTKEALMRIELDGKNTMGMVMDTNKNLSAFMIDFYKRIK